LYADVASSCLPLNGKICEGPEQILGIWQFQRERESGKLSVFKGLQKAYTGADSKEIEDTPFAEVGGFLSTKSSTVK
jgi:hypothetical protein